MIPAIQQIDSIYALPGNPAVYALYGGVDDHAYVAYVGVTKNLKGRIIQHLVARDSSIATRYSPVGLLNPDLVAEVLWWEDSRFADKTSRSAAELIAFEVLEPALRSRGGVTRDAQRRAAEQQFRDEMTALFTEDHIAGRLHLPTLETVLKRISQIEARLAVLEKREERSSHMKSFATGSSDVPQKS